MRNMTLKNLTKTCRGTYFGTKEQEMTEVSGIVLDSRKTEQGYLFLAVKGEHVDGHDFIDTVFSRGAACVMGEKEPEEWQRPYIRVGDSFRALRDIGEYYRKQMKIPVVGITGSVGKTSTKEFIASVLSQKFNVLKTEGNFNNEVGLPLTLLRIREEHEAAVLEMGISDFGEMHRLSKMAKPDICVMTNIGQCHLENLKSREGILRAKSEIFDYMNDAGYVCVNGDDDMLSSIEQVKNRPPITFGMNQKNSVYADNVVNRGLFGSSAVIHTKLGSFEAVIPLPGEHMIYNALAATAVGLQMRLSLEQIKDGIVAVEALDGRSHIVKCSGYTLIDDCYNANPVSMKAAIDLLAAAIGRKTAILGDMFELGEGQEKLHAEVGAYAADAGIDRIVCVGKISEAMYHAAAERSKGAEVLYFETKEDLWKWLEGKPLEGHTVLVKASHGMGFEQIVKELV